MTKLTIGMPVFNDIDFIEQSIKSILSQTNRDFVLIISDDCSSDGSGAVCERYAQTDIRIQYIRQEKNIGISKNLKFLLKQASTEYFMWAADDDLWAPTFIENLISLLDKKPSATSAFSTFTRINEKGEQIDSAISFNYEHPHTFTRLKNFIKNENDAFGYGIFRTQHILNVQFPVWWWPNNKCAYNNIYPSLCFYLAKGEYLHYEGEPQFFNRIKPNDKINHQLPFKENSFLETIAFKLRKFNLFIESLKSVYIAADLKLTIKILPVLFLHWFLKPTLLKFKHFVKTLFLKKK